MYSLNNVQFKQLSPILDLEVPIRNLHKAVVAIIADESATRGAILDKSYGKTENLKLEALSNQQGEMAHVPAVDDHDLTKAFYNAKSVYFGLAMKDIFLSAAIKGAVSLDEICEYVDPAIKTQETVKMLNDIGMPTLATIVAASCDQLKAVVVDAPQPA